MIAKAGETVTCESGHPICDAAEDIFQDTVASVRQFTNWRIAPPQDGTTIESCPECGARYIRVGPDLGLQLHIAGGWR